MELGAALLAGLIGTAAMTALMMLAPMMGMPRMKITSMLGTMFIEPSSAANIIGVMIHFVMGAVFGVIYGLLWDLGLGSASARWGIVIGLIHGILAMVTMPIMMNMHPRPPEMQPGMGMAAGLLLGHAVFGLVVALLYAAMV